MIRLGQLAAALASAGRTPLPAGTALTSLELSVAVAEPPVLAQDRLWRIAAAVPPPPWRRWLSRLRPGPRPDEWPWVRLTLRNGAVFASLIPPPPR